MGSRYDVVNLMWATLGLLFLCAFCLCGIHYVVQNDFGYLERLLIVSLIALLVAAGITAALLVCPEKGKK